MDRAEKVFTPLCAAILIMVFLAFAAKTSRAAVFCVSDAEQLQNALIGAQSNEQDDTIRIAQGTYKGNFAYYMGEPFALSIEGGYNTDCIGRQIEPGNTILDGNSAGNVMLLICDGSANFVVDGVTLTNGCSNTCGGLTVSTHGDVTITNNILSRNSSVGSFPGGLTIYTSENVIITNNVISHNSCSSVAGGVRVTGAGGQEPKAAVTFTNNIISDNSGLYGGVYLFKGKIVTFTNNIINNNSASADGGGIALERCNTVTLTNNTITANSAEHGGGVHVDLFDDTDTADIHNNIIWSNTASEGSDVYIENDGDNNGTPSHVSLFNNDFDQSADGIYIQIPFVIDPTNLNNEAPMFEDRENSDLHLRADSPCIDKATNDASGLPEKDKDGKPRIIDGDGNGEATVDMGAYEFGDICEGDFDGDKDVDGSDLAYFVSHSTDVTVHDFAEDFGRTDCPGCE